jgi:hypothetical protein
MAAVRQTAQSRIWEAGPIILSSHHSTDRRGTCGRAHLMSLDVFDVQMASKILQSAPFAVGYE